MTALDLLMNDHQEVMSMIDQIEAGGADASKMAIFNRIKSALQLHSQLEEQIFYPALKNTPETSELVADSYEEHQTVDELLAEISETSPEDAEFMELIAELRENLEHHVGEEENELFPKAERLLGQDRLAEMGNQMQQIKANNPLAA